ncbi:MAG: hypothetical protein HFH44_04375 [Lachnospiraceae bacterium]|nr:hypothetical protein [Lachnospiraceae bacterium]
MVFRPNLASAAAMFLIFLILIYDTWFCAGGAIYRIATMRASYIELRNKRYEKGKKRNWMRRTIHAFVVAAYGIPIEESAILL